MTHDPSSAVQRDPDGRLRHLITLEGLSAAEMVGLLNLAQFYLREAGYPGPRSDSVGTHGRQPVLRAEHAHPSVV